MERGDRPPDPRPVRPWLGASEYAAIGGIGVVLFVAGVVIPVLGWVPAAEYVRVGVAALGGFLAVIGLGRWHNLRQRRSPPRAPGVIPGLPSLEIHSPQRPTDRPPEREEELRPWTALVVAAVLAVLVLSGLPFSAPSPGGGPTSSSPAALAPPPSAGSVVPVCNPPFYPVYTTLAGLYPPLPLYSRQYPCKVAQDQVHATYSSTVAGSGEAFELPIKLPGGAAPGDSGLYSDFYVGMVVQGNPSSYDGQSYAALVFTPTDPGGHPHWKVTAAVWSMVLGTSCPVESWGPTGFNLTFADAYACEEDEVGHYNGTVLESSVPGGNFANVTMAGSATSSSNPLEVWFNDTTVANDSASFQFSAARTFTDEFRPYYVTACPDSCVLNWTGPFGVGVGVDLCDDSPACYSYNQSALLAVPPIEVGAPEFFTGIGYHGTYLYLSPESSTGACSGVGSVAPCTPDALAGYYPYFSFNGTVLDFGANFSYATEDFGGAYEQFNGYGTMNDYLPLFVDQLTNSSRAGYLAPGLALNVSARVQVLGRVANVNLSYVEPGAAATNSTIAEISGTASHGIYAGDVPATPTNGTLGFRVVAVDAAGGVTSAPAYPAPDQTVVRGPVPTFALALDTTPPGCGGISVNGSAVQPNGSVSDLLAGSYPVRAESCYPYVFHSWGTTGGVSVVGAGPLGTLSLSGNGTATATWSYVRPDDRVDLAWTPAGCGTTYLDGTAYLASGGEQSAELLNDSAYALTESSCGGESFSGWTVSNAANLTVLGPSVSVVGNGTLTETSVATSSSVAVLFQTAPVGCGGVRVRGVGYTNGESLNLEPGTEYAVGPDPCPGWGFNGTVSTSANVTIAAGELVASGPGVVSYGYYQLTLVTIGTSPSGCGSVLWDGVTESNGAVLNVTNHTLHTLSAVPCAGHYLETWDIGGDLTFSAGSVYVNGPGSVVAVYRSGSPEATVEFITDPIGCGSVDFGGTDYANAQSTDVTPGSVVNIVALACANYGFVEWVVSGGIQVVGTVAFVNSSGSLAAEYHGLVVVHIDTVPSTCGSVSIAGLSYTDGAAPQLPVDFHYPIVAVPCAHDVLASWQTTSGAAIANGSLQVNGSAVLTATFVPALYPVGLYVLADGCGTVSVNGVGYSNNSTVDLTAGAYPLTPGLCAGYVLSSWTSTGAVNVSGTTLNVNGAGAVTEVGAAVLPSLTLAVPTSAPTGSAIVLRATVAVPVPPFNYSFAWTFGDGTSATSASNFTSHAYGSPGTYEVRVTVVDPLGRTASAESNVTVVAASAGPAVEAGPVALAVIGVALGIVVVAVLVSMLLARRRRRTGGGPGSSPEADEGPSDAPAPADPDAPGGEL